MSITVAHSFPVWLPQTQTWLYNQVRFLPRTVKSHIICKETQNLDQFELPDIHALSGTSSWFSATSTRLFRHLDYHWYTIGQCKKWQPDVLHSHFGPVGWRNFRMLQFRKPREIQHMKHIVTFYGQDVEHLPTVNPVWVRRYREMFSHVDLVLCEGTHMAGKVIELGCPEERVRVHHLGVDLKEIAYQPRRKNSDEPFKVLMAAAFRPKKGFLYGLQALDRLDARFKIKITLVGDSTDDPESEREKERITNYLAGSPLSGKVTLAGFLTKDELRKVAHDHHIYLAPSVTADDNDSEGGAPVSLIEMAAGGMPVVSSLHCDIPEVIRHGEGGLLAEERDVESLATYLESLFLHPESWPEMTRKARERIESRYNAETQGELLSNVYKITAHSKQAYNKISSFNKNASAGRESDLPRLLVLSHSVAWYGAEQSLFTLLKGLKATARYDIHVMLPGEGPLTKRLRDSGIPCHVVPVPRWIGKKFHFIARYYRRHVFHRKMAEMAEAASYLRPDLIYTNSLATPAGSVLKEMLPWHPPHIWHARELPGQADFGFFDRSLPEVLKQFTKNTDCLICNSRYLAAQLDTMFAAVSRGDGQINGLKDKIHVIYNGFEMPGLQKERDAAGNHEHGATGRSAGSSPKSELRIVTAGSITPLKNFREAIHALSILIGKGIPARLDIYGDGPSGYIRRLRKEIRKANLEHYVTLKGFEPDIIPRFAAADLVLVTSRFETFGRVAAEAMSAGCPVVSSDAGGLPEVVTGGETGLLYRAGNPEELADRIAMLHYDPELGSRLADNAVHLIQKKFGMKEHVDRIMELINKKLPVKKDIRTAILLSTYHAGRYLIPLLESILNQEHRLWDLWIRDDGSTDDTVDRLHEFRKKAAATHPGNRIEILEGENIGIVGSFFTLLSKVPEDYDGYAFCDQDDIWLPDKLSRAAMVLRHHSMQQAHATKPLLYHSRQLLMDGSGHIKGKSPLPHRSTFANALIQNQVVGCTMVINPDMRQIILKNGVDGLIRQSGIDRSDKSNVTGGNNQNPIIMHDWWCYILASAFGIIVYDSRPTIKFRRHHQSTSPSATNRYRDWMRRAVAMGKRSWSVTHILEQAELFHRHYHKKPQHDRLQWNDVNQSGIAENLLNLKRAGIGERLTYFFGAKQHRSTWLETLLFRLLVIFRRY